MNGLAGLAARENAPSKPNSDLLQTVEGAMVQLMDACRRKGRTWATMAFDCVDGEIGGVSFTLRIGITGHLVVCFDSDYDRGCFVIEPRTFVEAAYNVYKQRKGTLGESIAQRVR